MSIFFKKCCCHTGGATPVRDEPTEGETEPAAAAVEEEPMETSTSEVPPTPEVPSTEDSADLQVCNEEY